MNTYLRESNLMNNDPEMTQMLELEDKNFKAGSLTVLKDNILIINRKQ